jgi:hypothetical protein
MCVFWCCLLWRASDVTAAWKMSEAHLLRQELCLGQVLGGGVWLLLPSLACLSRVVLVLPSLVCVSRVGEEVVWRRYAALTACRTICAWVGWIGLYLVGTTVLVLRFVAQPHNVLAVVCTVCGEMGFVFSLSRESESLWRSHTSSFDISFARVASVKERGLARPLLRFGVAASPPAAPARL